MCVLSKRENTVAARQVGPCFLFWRVLVSVEGECMGSGQVLPTGVINGYVYLEYMSVCHKIDDSGFVYIP